MASHTSPSTVACVELPFKNKHNCTKRSTANIEMTTTSGNVSDTHTQKTHTHHHRFATGGRAKFNKESCQRALGGGTIFFLKFLRNIKSFSMPHSKHDFEKQLHAEPDGLHIQPITLKKTSQNGIANIDCWAPPHLKRTRQPYRFGSQSGPRLRVPPSIVPLARTPKHEQRNPSVVRHDRIITSEASC